MIRSVTLVALLGLSPPLPAADLDAVRTIAVQDGGRLKPLDTFARETARRVGGARAFGAESMQSKEPIEWLVAMMADPDHWRTEPMVRVSDSELRSAAGLSADRDRFSFDEIVESPRFQGAVEALRSRYEGGAEPRLAPVEESLSSLYGTLSLLADVFSTEGVKLLPPSPGHGDHWHSVTDLHATGSGQSARVHLSALLSAYRRGDAETTRSAGAALARRLAQSAPEVYPSADHLRREVHYNRVKPFRLSWMLYIAGAGLALGAMAAGRSTTWGLLVVTLGWLVQTYGLTLRTLIAGRAPVTNMYESVVFVAWGAVLLALAFERIHRVGYAGIAAAILAVAALVTADSVPIMDGAIHPLVPVLRDNFWLTTHVLTISLGYAALLLAAGLGHLSLAAWLLAPERARASHLGILIYRSLQAGTLLLAAGTLLGGVWASYSWGRFWGWDPKETWALIALLGYLALLHARSAGVLREFGMAVGSVLSFLLVLMAWYGVNFVLGTGLHSYGFGSGGYGYAAAFAAVETAIVATAVILWRRRHAAAPVAATTATATSSVHPAPAGS